jgi:hypothetical protein
LTWARLGTLFFADQSALDLHERTLRRQPERVAGFRKVMHGSM